MLEKEKIKRYYHVLKIIIERYKFKHEWGFFREELVYDEEMFNWFYNSPNFTLLKDINLNLNGDFIERS